MNSQRDIIERLKKISIFQDIQENESALSQIADLITVKTFNKNDKIITEGEPGHEMYILNQGWVRVEKNTVSADKYTVVLLEDKQNIFFGELALVDSDLRSATVVAMDATECYVISQENIDKLSAQSPLVAYYIIKRVAKIISERLRKTNTDIVTLFEAFIKELED